MADELIEIERVRQLREQIIERLAAKGPATAALIDGIGLDLCGRHLSDHLGVTLRELATLSKAMKREVQRIWPDFEISVGGGRAR